LENENERVREGERERERVKGARDAIWVSKFNSAHEKVTESERREKEKERR